MIRSIRVVLGVAAALGFFIAGARGQTYQYTVPDKLKDGWETAAMGGEGLDAGMVGATLERIRAGETKNIQSVLIAKNGKLVVEEYFPRTEGDRREQSLKRAAPQEQTSATKSVTSILIGIAIDQHLISGVDEKVSTFFPEYASIFADADRAKLRLRDLLTMSAGLSWDEWTHSYADPLNDLVRMIRSDDPIRYVLEQPIATAPGAKFAYSSGLTIVLGQIIFKVSGLRADKFAERNLFEPLGITDFYWGKYPDEIVQTGGGLYLRPRDMAKIGQLVLDAGRWQGKQFVSEQWIVDSTKSHIDAEQFPPVLNADGYGYQWWVLTIKRGDKSIKTYSARGRGGQFIFVLPDQNMVVVFTCPAENPATFLPLEVLRREILPAVEASGPPTTR